jgi:hypothetical protein
MARRKAITFETAKGPDLWRLPVLTEDEIEALPPSAEVAYAARALGMGRTQALAQVREHGALLLGEDRIPVMKVGTLWRFRKADLLRALGMVPAAAGS